ncbi:transmembrane protein 59-like [Anneissia japonica]|uniref:transmembrane protein 59-like n=1 Tax=Anneissia japonica TaxID=1529436 RepID=UPI0014259BAE|nr:transmembrane protein 59-like [Anneissia japonica]
MTKLGSRKSLLIPSTTLIFILSACFRLNAAFGSFDSVLDDVSSCSETCENTYPMHTYPENDNLVACQRGCRLLSIVEFADEGMTDLNNTLTTCEGACKEAYDDMSEGACFACCLGCASQVPYIMQLREKYAQMEPVIHLLTPLLTMQNIYREIVDNAHGMIMSSWSVFMQSDNGIVYVFESKPRVDTFTLQSQYLNEDQVLVVDDVVDTSPSYDSSYTSNTSDWLSCVSYRSGLPEWLISLILFLSSASMIWLGFASCSTAKPQRVITPKKTYKYLDPEWEDLMKKYPVCVAESFDQGSMAEPLPIKVDIRHENTSI